LEILLPFSLDHSREDWSQGWSLQAPHYKILLLQSGQWLQSKDSWESATSERGRCSWSAGCWGLDSRDSENTLQHGQCSRSVVSFCTLK